jgi:hypothetical protein
MTREEIDALCRRERGAILATLLLRSDGRRGRRAESGSRRYSDHPEVPVRLSAPGPIRTGDLQVRSPRTVLTQPISHHPSPARTRSDELSLRPELGSDELGVGTVGAQSDAAVVPSLPERLRFPSDHAASVVVLLSERM